MRTASESIRGGCVFVTVTLDKLGSVSYLCLMQLPEFHFLLTGDQDIVLFVKQTNGSVLIHNAERSMGLKWKDGVYSADHARRLWSDIHDYGGRVMPQRMTAIISSLFENFVADLKTRAEQEVTEKNREIETLKNKVKHNLDEISRLLEEILGLEASSYGYMKMDAYDQTSSVNFDTFE